MKWDDRYLIRIINCKQSIWQIFPQDKKIYPKKRLTSKLLGGVLIALNNSFLSSEIPELDTNHEMVNNTTVGRRRPYSH